MRLQNSYIFLVNPKKQDIKQQSLSGNKRAFEFKQSVYSYVSKCFPGTTEYEIDGWDYQHKMVWRSDDHPDTCTVVFRFYSVIETTYLDVAAEGGSEEDVIKCLEYVHETLQSSGVCSDYVMILSYDTVSEYYCNKLYPKLNELERNLRKLLFNIYTVNFGRDYYKTTISGDIQTKAKENIRARGNADRKEVTVLQEFFYSLELGDVQQLLFTPRWTELDEQTKQAFLNEHSDLSMLSDADLRSEFADIAPKSDWDSFFSDKVSNVDFKGIIDTIRGYRNKVAHCKHVTQEEYQDCVGMIKQLNEAIFEAIKATEDKDFESKNRVYLQNVVNQLADAIQNLSQMRTSMASSMIQSVVSSMKDVCHAIAPSTELSDEDTE
jgi:hypothetical protein